MAAKAETLTVTAVRTKSPRKSQSLIGGFRRWMQKGQLGATNYTEMGRYTGGRV